jgi:NAD(P)-dependent dehydrogenase (short-subunit alcohol dehydrogenase family)
MSTRSFAERSVDLEQPDEPRFANPYEQSKIALQVLAREQGERWRELGVRVNACSPGWIATNMGGAGGGTLDEGVDTAVWLLTSPQLADATGRFFWQRRDPAQPTGRGRRRPRAALGPGRAVARGELELRPPTETKWSRPRWDQR